jgi:hypothetical protein
MSESWFRFALKALGVTFVALGVALMLLVFYTMWAFGVFHFLWGWS